MSAGAADLRRTQELFWTLITAPEGVRAAVEDLTRRGALAGGAIDAIFAGDARLPAAERLDVYANMYFYRLLECLGEDFPRVQAAVGGDRFHNLVTDYLLAHPSEQPSLRFLGRRLPRFLEAHALAREFPYLPDLARLDWARVEVFDAPDAVPLTRRALARLPEDRAGEARFTLIPAFELLPLRTAVRVWRSGFVVYHRNISEEEARCLEMVRAGEGLARICQQIAAGRSVARATERVGRILQGWIDDGILADVALAGREAARKTPTGA